MPISFHDADEVSELGHALFLHVSPASESEWLGALLFLNARGEPLEFVYNRIELLSDVLWRPADRERAAIRRLAMTLFSAATLSPTLLLCRANVVPPHLFGAGGQIELGVPVGRIATPREAVGYGGSEQQQNVAVPRDAPDDDPEPDAERSEVHLFWSPAPHGEAAELFSRLAERGLLLEPFERAARGLSEVYGEAMAPAAPTREASRGAST